MFAADFRDPNRIKQNREIPPYPRFNRSLTQVAIPLAFAHYGVIGNPLKR